MLTYRNQAGDTRQEFVDRDVQDADPVEIAADFDRALNERYYRQWDFGPEYAYSPAELSDPEASFKVYREAPDGTYVLVGAAHCELVHPPSHAQKW